MRAQKLLQARALGGRQHIPLKSRIFRVRYGKAIGFDQLPDTIHLLHCDQATVGYFVYNLTQLASAACRAARQLTRAGVQCGGMRDNENIASCKQS